MNGGRVIGICGGIGSGKSIVSRILRTRGYKVYDCDLEAKNLMALDQGIISALEERWGRGILNSEGEPERPKIAEIVFSDKTELAWLNSIVHKAVKTHLAEWIRLNEEEEALFVESAILGSSGLTDYCSEIWEITAPEDLRIARIELRSGMNAEEARSRINAQEAEYHLIRKSDCPVKMIVNDGRCSLLMQLPEI